MAYATEDDLIHRAGISEITQIADRNGDMIIDPEVIAAALSHADATINGYVGAKYDLPLLFVPDLLRTWAVSIARHVLHRDGAPDHVATDYKDAITGLKDVARGLIALPDVAGNTPASAAGVHIACAPPEVFSARNLRGWR